MTISARVLMALVVPAFIFAAVAAQPAMAQEKAKDAKAEKAAKPEKGKATYKELVNNDKVHAFEAHLKPGDEGANRARPFSVIRALKGGTIQRTYADGKTDKITWKTGEVKAIDAAPAFTPKNIGKAEVVLYVVELK